MILQILLAKWGALWEPKNGSEEKGQENVPCTLMLENEMWWEPKSADVLRSKAELLICSLWREHKCLGCDVT
jgi:hypothetical protein